MNTSRRPPRVVVIGASAGGVEALQRVVASLPHALPAAVCVVLHMPAHSPSALPAILRRSARLTTREVLDELPLEPATLYVCRPGHHLLVTATTVRLSRVPRENGHRPAVDPLFRSAARWHGPGVVGVVLSGSLDDGAAGAREVRNRGGSVVVQEPGDALYDGMPAAALGAVPDAVVLPATDIGAAVDRLVRAPVTVPPDADAGVADAGTDRQLALETDMAEFDLGALNDPVRPGVPAALTCPDCNGSLFEMDDDGVLRYRCRVGHAWTAGSLLAQQGTALEGALWVALRTLEDKAALLRQIADRAGYRGQTHSAGRADARAAEAAAAAKLIRDVLLSTDQTVGDESVLEDFAEDGG